MRNIIPVAEIKDVRMMSNIFSTIIDGNDVLTSTPLVFFNKTDLIGSADLAGEIFEINSDGIINLSDCNKEIFTSTLFKRCCHLIDLMITSIEIIISAMVKKNRFVFLSVCQTFSGSEA